jgi:predicted dienelactone hydrolase
VLDADQYDPFAAGPHAVNALDERLADAPRERQFPAAGWVPDGVRNAGLIVFSHHVGGHRRSASYLCRHLAAHGYVVAALDHSEVAAPELAPGPAETKLQRAARVEAIVASRVPDLRLLLDDMLSGQVGGRLDSARIGAMGHSLGGWTVLAAAQADERIRSVVALAPGGAAQPRPGVLVLPLTFTRRVPTLFVAGDADVPIPADHVDEVYRRTPGAGLMVVLRGADHQHFLDDAAEQHEQLRAMTLPGDAGWLPAAMRPITQLCPPEQAHRLICALNLAHFDATLRGRAEAATWLAQLSGPVLAAAGFDAAVHRAAT